VNLTEEEEAEALATPLLAPEPSEVDEFGAQLLQSLHSRNTNRMESNSSAGESSDNNFNMSNMSPMMMATSGQSNPVMKGMIASCLRMRTIADALPTILQPLVASGKTSFVVFLGGQLLLLALWLPFWIMSFVVSEVGVYAAVVSSVFLAGRAIIRMIAFPGSSHRISNEIEKEFAKYSVRVITSSATSLIDLAVAVQGTHGTSTSSDKYYEIPSLWKRAKSYRDRVLGVYTEVLHTTFVDNNSMIDSSPSESNKYGNNNLVGDIGNLSGLTVDAMTDGRILLNHLDKVLTQINNLEDEAKSFLENSTNPPPDAARQIAGNLLVAAIELRDFVESLKPPMSPGELTLMNRGESNENLSVDEVRRRLEEEQANTSIIDTIRMGAASIIPMLDPPLHGSIFGFDVLRGCVLARYQGARQLWVQRPSGGMIDCLHIPAKSTSPPVSTGGMPLSRNSKAVIYCNPNAGLIEIATGMSLAGGNVASDTDNVVDDNCWTDFYINAGFDMYLFNYAGFGRSHGGVFCGLWNGFQGDKKYTPGAWGIMKRICYGLFFSFRPTPSSLRADGLAVANHILSHIDVTSLVIHGESIGGLAASYIGRKLSENIHLKNKVSLLICDRTFCNLEAVAQRLVGGWSGYAIRMLAPFWSTDVVGDFLAATCPKVVANDSADAIIADSSSLKAGISFWKEIKRSTSSTKGIGWIIDAPLNYRMADWENLCVADSRYVSPPRIARLTAPVWPADKHVSLHEAFHFAACARRIGKLASIEKKRFTAMASSGILNAEEGNADGCRAPIFLVWKFLGCCEGLCGSPLGVTVKAGFDTTVSWLCSMCVFGGQTVVEGMEDRHKWSNFEACRKLHELGEAKDSDFDCRPPDYESQESDAVVHPKPMPEVLEALKEILEENPDDEILNDVSHEIGFVMDTLRYVMSRLSAPATIETSWRSRHFNSNSPMTEGSFMNLHCGHNHQFSSEERKRLKAVLEQATTNVHSPSVV